MSQPTDRTPASEQGRVRFLLIVLGIVAAGALIYATWPAAEPTSPPSNQGRDARKAQATSDTASALEVRLNDLKQPPPGSAEATRNPFRFFVKPPPPPPVVARPPQLRPGDPGFVAPGPPPPPPLPPIGLKFIGVMEQGRNKVAIFSDGKGQPVYAHEGEIVLGQYRLIRIGVESVTMSYLDGRGMQQIPMRGGE
jgi:hypothetical protein